MQFGDVIRERIFETLLGDCILGAQFGNAFVGTHFENVSVCLSDRTSETYFGNVIQKRIL